MVLKEVRSHSPWLPSWDAGMHETMRQWLPAQPALQPRRGGPPLGLTAKACDSRDETTAFSTRGKIEHVIHSKMGQLYAVSSCINMYKQ
jgi:hypothetical protein